VPVMQAALHFPVLAAVPERFCAQTV
jgi:hypothetical protein